MSKQKPSKLDAHAERLDEWFGIEKQPLKWVQEQLRQDGLVVSLSRLSDWWSARQSDMQEAKLLGQIATGARQSQEVEQAFGKNPPPDFATLIKLHRVLIMKLSTQSESDPEMLELVNRMMRPVIQFARLEQLGQQNRIEERKLELLEQKAKQAEQAQQVTADTGMSAEEKTAKMRQIFGMS